MSHFAINIFAVSSVFANPCIIRDKQSPIWSITPFGAVFSIVSLTDASTPPFFSLSRKDKSRIEQNAFDLCGIAVIREIFNSLGGLSLILSRARCGLGYYALSQLPLQQKCVMASGVSADW
jgi:hypothetical protein